MNPTPSGAVYRSYVRQEPSIISCSVRRRSSGSAVVHGGNVRSIHSSRIVPGSVRGAHASRQNAYRFACARGWPVQNGSFKGPVKPGKKRVEIRAYRDAKSQAAGDMYKGQEMPGGAGKENYLPGRFNTESTMSAEVSDKTGLTPNVFEVQSK